MIEIGLILALNVAGLLAAVAVERWIARHDTGTPDGRRVVGAVQRSMQAFVQAELRVVAFGAPAVGLVVFPVVAFFGTKAGSLDRTESAVGCLMMTLAGALATCLYASFCIGASLRASARVAAGARVSLERVLTLAVRAGGAIGLVGETLSLILVAGTYAAYLALKGAFSKPLGEAVPLAAEIATLLPGFALGAAVAALVLQRGGAIFRAASDSGGSTARALDSSVDHDDPRNPAVISELVGDQVGLLTSRSVDLFVSSVTSYVLVLVVGAIAFAAKPEPFVLQAAALPLIVRAFGVLASTSGILVVRTREGDRPEVALWRGQAAAFTIALGGVMSATLWLVEANARAAFLAAGALGLTGALGAAHYQGFLARRRAALTERTTAATGRTSALWRGLGGGLEGSLVPAVLFGLLLVLAYRVGAGTELPEGALLSSLTTLSAMLATISYASALGALEPIARTARGVARVGRTSSDDGLRRTARLGHAAIAASTVAQNQLILSGFVAALGAAAATLLVSGAPRAEEALLEPFFLWSGALGAAAVLGYAGSAARAAARGADDVAREVERQLRSVFGQGGSTLVPNDHTPNYRACIELSSRHGLGRLFAPIGVGLGLPLLLGLSVDSLFRSIAPASAPDALVAYVVVGALTGLGAAMLADGMRIGIERGAPSESSAAVAIGTPFGSGAFGDLLGNTAGPAAQLLAKAAAVTVLAVAPFLQ